jgi:hypothetical protein
MVCPMGSDPRRIAPLGEPGADSLEWDDDLIIGSCEERLRRSEYRRAELEDAVGVYQAALETHLDGEGHDRAIVTHATAMIHAWWHGGTEDLTFRRFLADLATLIPLPDAPSE